MRGDAGKNFNLSRSFYSVLLDWDDTPHLLDESERGGFVTNAHIGQREIANQLNVFWLFFEKSFQFVACLPPTFLRGGMIAREFLRPA